MAEQYDYLFKVILLGDSGVGKTSIILRFSDNTFSTDYHSTIGVDFRVSQQIINNKSIKLQLWDTAGQERFRNIVSSYYRVAHAALFIFDLTNLTTFENLTSWISESDNFFKDSVSRFLIGNKCDLETKRAVPQDRARTYAERLKMSYLEVSAKTSENIQEAFRIVSCSLIEQNSGSSVETSAKRIVPGESFHCCRGS